MGTKAFYAISVHKMGCFSEIPGWAVYCNAENMHKLKGIIHTTVQYTSVRTQHALYAFFAVTILATTCWFDIRYNLYKSFLEHDWQLSALATKLRSFLNVGGTLTRSTRWSSTAITRPVCLCQ